MRDQEKTRGQLVDELRQLRQQVGELLRVLEFGPRWKEQTTAESLQKPHGVFEQIVQALAIAVELRDPLLAAHHRRVANLAKAMGKELGFVEDQVGAIGMAGRIHDIGRLLVPDAYLQRPDPSTGSELDPLHDHVELARDILSAIEWPWPIPAIVHQHHERMDGSGGPSGASGDEILLEARVLAVADVFDLMVWRFPFHAPVSADAALGEISRGRGLLYDANVVDGCLKLLAEGAFSLLGSDGGRLQ